MKAGRAKAPIKRRLLELAKYAMAAVDLSDLIEEPKAIGATYSGPGENTTTPTFFLTANPGRTDPASFGRSGRLTIDRFTVGARIIIPGFPITDQGAMDAEEAAERALNAFAAAVETSQNLVNADVASAMTPDQYVVSECFISDSDLYHGIEDVKGASLSGGATFTIEAKYPLKPTALPSGS